MASALMVGQFKGCKVIHSLQNEDYSKYSEHYPSYLPPILRNQNIFRSLKSAKTNLLIGSERKQLNPIN
jgi:hypothetical protein